MAAEGKKRLKNGGLDTLIQKVTAVDVSKLYFSRSTEAHSEHEARAERRGERRAGEQNIGEQEASMIAEHRRSERRAWDEHRRASASMRAEHQSGASASMRAEHRRAWDEPQRRARDEHRRACERG